ncbi:B-box zinc finger protein 20-like [Vigna umbellata]|uniref:B-box zinc finger protein 20-like n=1 Tax=Vigna umbellata TaxID=87088 RepID=UPI001F5E9E49|nr:B-box zinc finger protein 20-like [Vigna umbellata]
MKIQCDVCHKEVASFFCPADEAALCHACDRTIHHANKLAHKHKRLSLSHPTSIAATLCDICHEKRAYVFCRQDRALLCRQCDVSIHDVNEHTKTHDRFLFTGITLEEKTRTTSTSSTSNPAQTSLSNENIDSFASSRTLNNSSSVLTGITLEEKTTSTSSTSNENIDPFGSSRTVYNSNSVSTSSLSEYLIQTIPGYCMEDLLDASFAASNAFSKDYEFPNEDVQVSMCSIPLQTQFNTASNVYPEMPKAKAGEGYSDWIHNSDSAAYKVPSITSPLVKKIKRSR